ncbi:hypothetical protein FACS189464_3140 [Bacteroidia bacterium]|nr:hypothetical protein FACS189464_3140 [Bacteroidia bacterium]
MATLVKTRKVAKPAAKRDAKENVNRRLDAVKRTENKPKMVNIVLSYNSRDTTAVKTLDYILSLGIFKAATPKSSIYKKIEAGLMDVKDMVEGKKPKITYQQFINEL